MPETQFDEIVDRSRAARTSDVVRECAQEIADQAIATGDPDTVQRAIGSLDWCVPNMSVYDLSQMRTIEESNAVIAERQEELRKWLEKNGKLLEE